MSYEKQVHKDRFSVPGGVQWPSAYHGYNTYDPNRANRYFGSADPKTSREKLKELVDTCHANGLKVILDVVPNHLGDFLQETGANAHYHSSASGLKAGTQLQPASPLCSREQSRIEAMQTAS